MDPARLRCCPGEVDGGEAALTVDPDTLMAYAGTPRCKILRCVHPASQREARFDALYTLLVAALSGAGAMFGKAP